ncbi:hypothetical protein HAX54_030491 [Datura stramonium]|uniref:PGG domain-containing protein n=1 Tax=Datura stramonium TaxID=4076 RepID=A0ABS8VA48_DATST|nr:hypothetical protein [Datura stramonium]
MRGHVELVKLILTRNPLLAAELNSKILCPSALLQSKVGGSESADENDIRLSNHECERWEEVAIPFLHLAVGDKQIETVKYLLKNNKIEVDLKDDNGNTALDILAQSRRDMNDLQIGESLREAGGLRANEISSSNTQTVAKFHNKESPSPHTQIALVQKQDMAGDWLSKKRDAIMVVASLIATMAFQAGMNPPGGFTFKPTVNSQGKSLQMPHKAGEAVMAYSHPKSYRYFIRVNTTAFVASLSTILLLISGLPFRKKLFTWALMVIMWLAVTSVALTYGISIYIVTPKKDREQLSPGCEVAVTIMVLYNGITFSQKHNSFKPINGWQRSNNRKNSSEQNLQI